MKGLVKVGAVLAALMPCGVAVAQDGPQTTKVADVKVISKVEDIGGAAKRKAEQKTVLPKIEIETDRVLLGPAVKDPNVKKNGVVVKTAATDTTTPPVDVDTNDKPVEVAEPVKPKPVSPSLIASVDLTRQTMTIKEHGKVKYTWKISSGRAGYHTPTGTFKPKWMSRMHYSRQYDNAPMPHSVFFHRGYAVHATYATGRLGRPASHGCIRLSPRNARRFYKLVQKHSMKRTRVSLHGVTPVTPRTYAKKRKKLRQRRRTSNNYTYTLAWGYKPKPYKKAMTWPGDAPAYKPRRKKRRYRRSR